MGKNRQNIKNINYKDKKKLRDQKRQIYDKRASAIIEVAAPMFFIGLAAVYPLFVWKSKYHDITYDKTLFLWIFTALFAGVFLLVSVFRKCLNIKTEPAVGKPPLGLAVSQWGLVAFLAFALFSALTVSRLPWGEEVKEVVWFGYPGRYEGFISFLCYGVVFFVIAKFYKPRRWHLFIVAASAILLSLYGILQFTGNDIFELFPFEQYPDYGPLSAYFLTTLGNINIVSAYCTFSVILFAALFAVSDTFFRWDVLYLAASSLSFVLMLIARGDASYVAVAVSTAVLIPYWISDKKKLGKILIVLAGWCLAYLWFCAYVSGQKELFELDPSAFAGWHDHVFLRGFEAFDLTKLAVLAAGLLFVGLFFVLVLKPWPKRAMKIAGIVFLPAALVAGFVFLELSAERLAQTPGNILWQLREVLHGRLEDDFGSSRGWVWKRGFAVVFDRPVFGAGPDAFYYALGELQFEAMYLYRIFFDKAHNMFLQIAVCLGLPAFMGYMAFLGGLFGSAIKKAFERPLLFAFGAAALSYTVQSFFCVEVPLTTPLLWVCLGVMAREVNEE